jgi:Tol biopolymer transport system component
MPDDRDQRIDALRDLAREGAQEKPLPSPDRAASPAAPRRSRKALLAGISALVVVVMVGGLIARAVLSSAPPKQQQASVTRVFDPKSDGVSCPKDARWSPDGKTLALLGYQQNCANDYPGSYAYHPGIIALYDQATGKLTNTIEPDPLIAAALHLNPPKIATPDPYAGVGNRDTSQQVVDYAHLLWSPDGKQLAVTFMALLTTKDLGNGGFDTQAVEGVLLVSPSGGNEQALSHTLARGEWYSGLWNLATGAYVPMAAPPERASNDRGWYAAPPFSQPALGYQWASDGRLQPVTPLNATSAPAIRSDTPIGQPDGGKAFSIWQPGYVRLITQWNSNDPPYTLHTLKTPVEIWAASLASWSSDGVYLYAGNLGDDIANWRIALDGQPAPDPTDLAAIGLVGAPVLPVRDAGMSAILRRYHDASIDPNAWATQINLAWSPDGKRVAVEAPVARPSGSARVSDFDVSIYDCASGKLLKTLTPKLQLASVAPYGGFGPEVFLRWSPDGKQLLLYYPLLSGAQIWGSQDLPR